MGLAIPFPDSDLDFAMLKLLRHIFICICTLSVFVSNTHILATPAPLAQEGQTPQVLVVAWKEDQITLREHATWLKYDPTLNKLQPFNMPTDAQRIGYINWSPDYKHLMSVLKVDENLRYCLFDHLLVLLRCLEGIPPSPGDYTLSVHWSPDGQLVQYITHPSELIFQIVEASIADGKIKRVLLNYTPTDEETQRHRFSFVWNAKSSKIAIAGGIYPSQPPTDWAVKVFDAETQSINTLSYRALQQQARLRLVNEELELCGQPSPQGTYIAAVRRSISALERVSALLLFNTNFEMVTSIPAGEEMLTGGIECPIWASDESYLYEYSLQHGTLDLFAKHRRIGWLPNNFQISPDRAYMAATWQVYDEQLNSSIGAHVLKRGGDKFVRIDAPYKESYNLMWLP
jgi:hypothetical protein